MNIVGFSLCNWINYGLSFAGGAVAWRFPLAFQAIFIIALFATVPWLPESPRWLLYHGHDDEARKVLRCLATDDMDDALVTVQHEEIQYSVRYEKEHQIRWRDLLRPQPGATKPLRRLILGAGTQFIQQFEGMLFFSLSASYCSSLTSKYRHQHHVLLLADGAHQRRGLIKRTRAAPYSCQFGHLPHILGPVYPPS